MEFFGCLGIIAIFLAVFFVVCWFIFNYTKVGRRNKFIGSNKVAARFNGINLMRAGIISFAISGSDNNNSSIFM